MCLESDATGVYNRFRHMVVVVVIGLSNSYFNLTAEAVETPIFRGAGGLA